MEEAVETTKLNKGEGGEANSSETAAIVKTES